MRDESADDLSLTYYGDDGLTTISGRADLMSKFLNKLIEQDQQDWPDGHPCRDCGRLHREHPWTRCEGWR